MSTTTTPEYKDAKAQAKASKAYAKAQRPFWKKKRAWLLGGVAGIATIAVLSQGGGAAEPTGSDNAPSAAAQAKPDVKVQAANLIKDFEDNELAADAKYKGKTLSVTGVVENIDTDMWDEDEYILNLTGGGNFEILTVSVHGMSQEALSKAKTGETVTVIAEFEDGGDLGVDLKDGRFA